MRLSTVVIAALLAVAGLWNCNGVSGSCTVNPAMGATNQVSWCVEYASANSTEQMADQATCTNLRGMYASGACNRPAAGAADAVLGRCYNSLLLTPPRGDGGVATSPQRAFVVVYSTGGINATRAQSFCRDDLQGFWVTSSN